MWLHDVVGLPLGIGTTGQHGDHRREQVQPAHGHNRTRQAMQMAILGPGHGDCRMWELACLR